MLDRLGSSHLKIGQCADMWTQSQVSAHPLGNTTTSTGKNNRFPISDILGYSKNTYKNPKFGKVRQVPTRELPTKFPGWDLSHSSNLGFLWVFFKYLKYPKMGICYFFLCSFPGFYNRPYGARETGRRENLGSRLGNTLV